MIASRVYFLLTGLSVLITATRAYVLAAILPADAFGNYVAVIALGAFGGILLGFGKIDQTRKHFPQMWERGYKAWVVGQSREVDHYILLRAGVVFGCLILGSLFVLQDWLEYLTLTICFATSVAICSSGAAYLRSTGNILRLGQASLLRACGAFGFSVLGGWLFSWQIAVLAEALAGLLFWSFVWWQRHQVAADEWEKPHESVPATTQAREGRLIFLASFCNALPFFTDRTFLKAFSTADVVSSYGFVMLVIVGASTFSGAQAQWIGPILARLNTDNTYSSHRASLRVLLRSLLIQICLSVASVAAFAFLFLHLPFANIGSKYGINIWHVIAAGVLAFGQVTVLLEWYLISVAREKNLVIPAVFNLIIALSVLCLWPWSELSLVALIWGLSLAKLLQACLLVVAIVAHQLERVK